MGLKHKFLHTVISIHTPTDTISILVGLMCIPAGMICTLTEYNLYSCLCNVYYYTG